MDPERLSKECAETPSKLFRPHVDAAYFIVRATYFSTVYFVHVVAQHSEPIVTRTYNMCLNSLRTMYKTMPFSQQDYGIELLEMASSLDNRSNAYKARLRKTVSKVAFFLKRSMELLFVRIPAVFVSCALFATARIISTALHLVVACCSAVLLFLFFTLSTVYGNVAFVIRNFHKQSKELHENNIATEFLRSCGVRPEEDVNDYFGNELRKNLLTNNENLCYKPRKFSLVKASLKYCALQAASYVFTGAASLLLFTVWIPFAMVFPVVSIIIAIPTFAFSALSSRCTNVTGVMDAAQQAFGTDTTIEPLFTDRRENQEHYESIGEPGVRMGPQTYMDLSGASGFRQRSPSSRH
ncbi:hypothetical protein ANPL_03370 [Anaplasma platys]|uniref:Uncharacterized protein n=2 Tax=Anaplasma platys TaxID=949 RepID=A0A858PYT9_9RICK|nr:hypothetical protein ANPL_03370 [Anaplasma platys]